MTVKPGWLSSARYAGALVAAALVMTGPVVAASGHLRVRAASVGCALPLVVDRYDGFQIGVPGGWELFRLGGELVVASNASGTEDAIVDPALLTDGLTAARFFAATMADLLPQLRAGGNAFSYRLTSSSNELPQASVSGRVGPTAVEGTARVSIRNDPTEYGAKLIVLSLYWAPTARFAAQAATLAAVGGCYAPRPAELFEVTRDQDYTYSMPPGWHVAFENQATLEITLGPPASAYYRTEIVTDNSVDSAPTLTQYALAQFGLTVSTRLNTLVLAAQRSANGTVDQSEYLEFIGTLEGNAVHGIIGVESLAGEGVTGAVIRLALASPSAWNADSGALLRIMGGIQYHFSADIQQWNEASSEWQQFGQQVEGVDEALNGEDLVEDPATGQIFQAPYDAYDDDGPSGPGYYAGSQKLRVITP